MHRILAIADKHKVPVIGDGCQAHLAEWRSPQRWKPGQQAAGHPQDSGPCPRIGAGLRPKDRESRTRSCMDKGRQSATLVN